MRQTLPHHVTKLRAWYVAPVTVHASFFYAPTKVKQVRQPKSPLPFVPPNPTVPRVSSTHQFVATSPSSLAINLSRQYSLSLSRDSRSSEKGSFVIKKKVGVARWIINKWRGRRRVERRLGYNGVGWERASWSISFRSWIGTATVRSLSRSCNLL